MKNLSARLFTMAALLVTPLLAPLAGQAQNWQWVARTHGRGGAAVSAVATDAAGNTYVVGGLEGTVSFGVQTITGHPLQNGYSFQDAFVAKLDPQGQWLWVRTVPTPNDDRMIGVAVLPNGDVAVTGTLTSIPAPITLGPTTLAGPVLSPLGYITVTTYVARLSAAGAWQWATQIDATTREVRSSRLAVDAAGNVYVSGIYSAEGAATFGATTIPAGIPEHRTFVASLNPIGQWRWAANQPGMLGTGELPALAFSGNTLYTGGQYVAVAPLGGTGRHALLAAIEPATGAWRWTRRDTALALMPSPSTAGYYQPKGSSSIQRLVPDAAGNLAMLGSYYGHVALEGIALPSSGSPYDPGGSFLTRFDAQGTALVAPLIVRNAYVNLPTALAVDVNDQAVVGGTWEGVMQMNCGTGFPGQVIPMPPPIQDTLWFGSQRLVGEEMTGYLATTANGQWQSTARGMAVRDLCATRMGGEFIAAGELYTTLTLGAITCSPDSSNGLVVAKFNSAAPVLTVVSSPGGLVGTALTLTGTHFTGATQVLFNGVPATFTVVNGTTITVTVPVGATTGLITVLTPQGGAASPQVFQVGSPLGLSADVATRLALWPNPAHDLVRLTVGETATDVTVLDGLGRAVRQVPGARGTVALLLTDLPAGTYTVRAGARVARLVRQ